MKRRKKKIKGKNFVALVLLLAMLACISTPAVQAEAMEITYIQEGTIVNRFSFTNEDGSTTCIEQLIHRDGTTEVNVYENGNCIHFDGVTLDLNNKPGQKASEIGLPTKVRKYTKSSVCWSIGAIAGAIAAGVGVAAKKAYSVAKAIYAGLNSLSDEIYFVSTIEQTQVSDGATTYYRASVLTYGYSGGYYGTPLGHGVFSYQGTYPL